MEKESSLPERKLREKTPMESDFEEALDLAGAGKYQLFHCALMLMTLAAAIVEIIGNAFILPAAACDLGIPGSLKGLVTSIPNIGIILTAPLWGQAADILGRKPVLLTSCAASGVLGLAAAVMPNLWSFALCKLAAALFLACPSSLGFAYMGEMVPRKRRDLAVLVCNGLLMVASLYNPALAWPILISNWHYQLGSLTLRPWRLLTAVYAFPLILSALWMTQAKESPKFLMAKGKPKEALEVLKHVFMKNTGKTQEDFPRETIDRSTFLIITILGCCSIFHTPYIRYILKITSLKSSSENPGSMTSEDGSVVKLANKPRSQTALALLRPPHLKWMALTGFLMFGLFSLLNGLFMFATDTVNKVMQDTRNEAGTICILVKEEVETSSSCNDEISSDAFQLMVWTTLAYGVLVLGASLCPVSKRALLVAMFVTTAFACLLAGVLTNRMVAGAAMSALQLTSLGIGPLTAYAVQLFPTTLRGTAVGAVLMCGRVGSVLGANVAGCLLAVACSATFYMFTALLFLCALLSLLLPNEKKSPPVSQTETMSINQPER